MLFDLTAAITEYALRTGVVVHVGGHRGQEGAVYSQWGSRVTWFEPLAACALAIQTQYPKDTVITAACGETWGVRQFHVANNEQSSSLLAPKIHLQHYPETVFESRILVPVVPLDAVITAADGLVMDVQGAEKLVLLGAQQLLQKVQWVYSEVNDAELYADCTQIGDLDSMLADFVRVITVWRTGKNWGDALWVRK